MSYVPERWERERIEELRDAADVLLSATNYAETYWGRLRIMRAINALADEATWRAMGIPEGASNDWEPDPVNTDDLAHPEGATARWDR